MKHPPIDIPPDFSTRVKALRGLMQLTQMQLAERMGVSFATINRWENNQAKPTKLAWQKIAEFEAGFRGSDNQESTILHPHAFFDLDFVGKPEAVSTVAEAHRLTFGHLFNPAFATEISLIDPLPHQRLAVYEQMLHQSPLRFLLADDAGAGKTIMAGLCIREMLSRRLIKRVLIIPPAGLVGNWERELRSLFRLNFRIVRGADSRHGNPFEGQNGDHVIVSVDTMAGERTFARLQEGIEPYDLVVFDEAHKLSADREPDFRVRKTDRYRLAEALAGLAVDNDRWRLSWSAQHLLLLTATPHMGKDFPYYCLWRLLCPDALPTYEAFRQFPDQERAKYFIRRTKEEMVRYDGTPLYPERICDTLSYELGGAPEGEQELYDETTAYIRTYYNRARILNRSAARLAMGVFQRRLASSTFALLRSLERRLTKLDQIVDDIRSGKITEDDLLRQQKRLDRMDDAFESTTADEDSDPESGKEIHEEFEDNALGSTVAVNIAELGAEREEVQRLMGMARKIVESGNESKFEKLREVLREPTYSNEKFIIFTEHRDTATFLIRKLEGLGYVGKIAQIHGGMDYLAREEQVERFRKPMSDGGAQYLVATDAAGEGINLQFCWLMVNYDVPWNPARLEQRMGRIHRYGQKHDPVVIINLVAGKTREGRVLHTLLDKLELIRKQLHSDKVFDVVGRLFQGISISDYLARALTDEDADQVGQELLGVLTEDQVRALEEKERKIYGEGGDVQRLLPSLKDEVEQEHLLRLLPGYVRRFIERAAPLLDLEIRGDLEGFFQFEPRVPGAMDALFPALEMYPIAARTRLSVYRQTDEANAIWLHPGEQVFDAIAERICTRFDRDARRGGIFVDPTATSPYLFHMATISVERHVNEDTPAQLIPASSTDRSRKLPILEARLLGIRQFGDGRTEECAVEHLMLLEGARHVAPGSVPLAGLAQALRDQANVLVRKDLGERVVEKHRQKLLDSQSERIEFVTRGFDHQTSELAATRSRLTERARAGDSKAQGELEHVKTKQRELSAQRENRIAQIKREPEEIAVGEVAILASTLVVPSESEETRQRFDAEVEAIAMRIATAYEQSRGATVHDVSKPALARAQGLTDWPGFDLLAVAPGEKKRPIEVKGRAGVGEVEMKENEWAKACNLRDEYWLYVVYDCATANPRLLRVRDPFGALLVKTKAQTLISANAIQGAAESEQEP